MMKARQESAAMYGIDLGVLDTVGALSAEVGRPEERRKAHAKDAADRRDFTGDERAWLEAVAEAMIRRAAIRAENPTTPASPVLKMIDFPQGVTVRHRN